MDGTNSLLRRTTTTGACLLALAACTEEVRSAESQAAVTAETRRVIEIWEAGAQTGRMEDVASILAPNVHYKDATSEVRGKEEVLELLESFASASGGKGIPKFEVLDIIEGGAGQTGRVAVTVQGDFGGTPLKYAELFTVRDGAIVDYESIYAPPANAQ